MGHHKYNAPFPPQHQNKQPGIDVNHHFIPDALSHINPVKNLD